MPKSRKETYNVTYTATLSVKVPINLDRDALRSYVLLKLNAKGLEKVRNALSVSAICKQEDDHSPPERTAEPRVPASPESEENTPPAGEPLPEGTVIDCESSAQ